MNSSILLFLNMGTPEIMMICFAALLLFGGKKLPELARGLGKGIREFKDASEGVKREIHRNINNVNTDLDIDKNAPITSYEDTEATVAGITGTEATVDGTTVTDQTQTHTK